MIISAFRDVLVNAVRSAGVPLSDVEMPANLQEFGTMLQTRLAAWVEGERQEVRREGLRDGQARTLLLLMERRFGAVPDAVTARIASATVAELDEWTPRVLDARDLDDLCLAIEATQAEPS